MTLDPTNPSSGDPPPDGQTVLSRRDLLKGASALGLSLAAAPLLSACGGGDGGASGTTAATTGPAVEGATASERAINGVLALKKAGSVSDGDTIKVLFADGNVGSWTGDDGVLSKEWEQLTGVKIDVSTSAPTTGIYDKMILESVSKAGDVDVFDTFPKFLGDFVNAGVVADLTDFTSKYDPVLGSDKPDGFIPPIDRWGNFYANRVYQLYKDNDVMSLYIRSDLIEDPKEQKDFEVRYGYPLAIPETWDQYRDVQEFFHRPPDLYGSAEQRNIGWGYGWWMMRYITKGSPWMQFWDEDMTPLINSSEGIRATEQYVETVKFSHPDILSWSFTETVGQMAAGQAATDVRWPFLSFFVQGPDSKVKGKIAYALPPGDEVDGTITRRAIMQFGTSTAVNAHSKNAELSYLFLQWLNSPEKGPLVRGAATGFADASVRWNDLDNDALKAKYPPEYFEISQELAQITVPEPSLPGANEYIDILDRNLQEAAQGNKSAKEAMDDSAAGWDDVTDRLGRDKQAETWRQFLSDIEA